MNLKEALLKSNEYIKGIINKNKEDVDTEISELSESIIHKLDKPETPPIVGKVLKIKSVNEDGTFVCEWAESSGNVNDVQIDGESILDENKNANFESSNIETVEADSFVRNTDYASVGKGGVVRIAGRGNTLCSDGILLANELTQSDYSSASVYSFVGKGTLENIKSDLVQRAFEETSVESEGSVIPNAYLDKMAEVAYNGWSISKYYKINPNTFYSIVSIDYPNSSFSRTYSAMYDENKNPVGMIDYFYPRVFFSKTKGYIRVSGTTTTINSLEVSVIPFVQIFDNVLLKTGYATQALIDGRKSTESYISPNNLEYAVTSVGNSIYEPKKGEWVLKGTLTTENKDVGVNVDLTGCTEMYIKSRTECTGDVNLTANGDAFIYRVGTNGTRTIVARWEDGMLGIDNLMGKLSTSTSTSITAYATNAEAYSRTNGKKISEYNKFNLSAPANVTSCNIEIYAR